VAGFIGTPAMNLIRGSLRSDGNRLVFEAGRLSLKLPAALVRRDAVREGGVEVVLGVRPEDVGLSGDGERAAVKVVEPTGHESIVFFGLMDHTVVGRVGPDVRLAAGEPVGLTLNAAKLHVFAAADGRRLNADQQPPAAQAAPSLVA
jgi:multiple sugar transport system ATP-binding protein